MILRQFGVSATAQILDSVYLISIEVANRAKDKFYGEDLPSLEDVSVPIYDVSVVPELT